MVKTNSQTIYHVLNRGVEKRKIFMDDKDRLRFMHDLFEFNDEETVPNSGYHFNQKNRTNAPHSKNHKERKLLVNILVFCLMPNHYHLLIKPLSDRGLPEFIKKVNGGYAKYFNYKYERSGALFQGKYKHIPITNERHLIHLPYYIHCNPLDLLDPKWREGKVSNPKRAFNFLKNYRWSSFPDYIGQHNFPSITQRELLLKFFGSPNQYKKDTNEWLKEMELESLKRLTLE